MNECPTCGASVSVEGAEEGEILTCSECGTELEVLTLDPVQVAPAPETKEDWGE